MEVTPDEFSENKSFVLEALGPFFSPNPTTKMLKKSLDIIPSINEKKKQSKKTGRHFKKLSLSISRGNEIMKYYSATGGVL